METPLDNFPVWGLLPKKETGVTSFLSKYPEYNGKDVVIAIFDSGVDPGAAGLKETPDGKVKVIERFDCSGCGDVNMATVVQPNGGVVTGVSGRKLRIPSTWNNPSNNYRIGIKNSFDLYPERLRERMQDENKEKNWHNQHKLIVAEAARRLSTFESKFGNGQTLSEEDKLEKENLEALVEYLNNCDKKYTDLGIYYDCIMFNDGAKWMACVDTTEVGDLEKCKLLGEYSITHEFSPLSEADQLNFSINVHDHGNVLELVGLCSSHGTHVASITAAYFPDEPEKNGVAPGAQIVSLTIGDGRLGSMETGTALVRAMIKVMEMQKENRVDIINMSYGEHARWANTGRVGELMNEVVNKHNVVWVASAGNHGPALSTIGTPPDISQETIIGVGAYVSPDMMVAEYAMRTKMPGMPYTWSSRGPTIDGGIGVTVCAPGGAITSVPNFTLRNSQLMNGTSMAAPHVSGAVGILISGLKQKGLSYSAYQVKRALENSAGVLQNIERFAQGSGLLNVEKAFQLLVDYNDAPEKNIRFHISCGANNSKGIYIRNKTNNTSSEFSVSVEPYFLEMETVTAASKIDFNLQLVLTCKESYVNHPQFLNLTNMSRVFAVKIDTEGLVNENFTFLEAYDVNCVDKGPVFKIPITVIKPVDVIGPTYSIQENAAHFLANTIKRNFITVPEFATWAVIRMRSCEVDNIGKFVVHCMHILPRQSCKYLELNKHVTVTSNNECVLMFQVRGLATLEVVLAKYWASVGKIQIDYSISFFGIKPNQSAITMLAVDGIHQVDVNSLQGEEIMPSISLKNSVQILKATDSKITPLSSRDVVPPGRQIYELNLTYNFHLNKATEVSPNYPLLSDLLYESDFESQLWMLYDTNKQYLGCGDAYPCKYNIKLEKGDYIIKLQVRHDKRENLEKITDTPLLLSQKLSTAIVLDVYSSYSQAVVNGKKAAIGHSLRSSTIPLYIAPLALDKFVAKNNNAAHYLTGSITYTKDELSKRVDVYSVKYVLPESSKKTTKTPEKVKPKSEEYKDALRELKLSWLQKLDFNNGADDLYNEMLKDFPDYLPVHVAYLQCLEPMDSKRQLPILNKDEILAQKKDDIRRIIEVCEKALEGINQDHLLMYQAVKVDQRTDAVQIKQRRQLSHTDYFEKLMMSVLHRKIPVETSMLQARNVENRKKDIKLWNWTKMIRKNSSAINWAVANKVYSVGYERWTMDRQKTVLIECLSRKGISLCRLFLMNEDDVKMETIVAVWKCLLQFVDPNDTKSYTPCVSYFNAWYATVLKHYGKLLKCLAKINEEKPSKEVEEKLSEIYTLCNWPHLSKMASRQILAKYPNNFRPF